MAFTLSEIIPWGRSFDEYRRFFALEDHDLDRRILGCGDGPASFNAEATARGHSVVSCDPMYSLAGSEIERRVQGSYGQVMAQVHRHRDDFVWNEIRDPEELGQHRLGALDRFLSDYDAGQAEGRYVTAALPALPFENDRFDLALVSHLLFLYTDHLSLEFHAQSILELLRVAREVRIYPLLTLAGQFSSYVEPTRELLTELGFLAEVCPVPFEFQRGSTRMLAVKRRPVQ